jgi:hypothetical protein
MKFRIVTGKISRITTAAFFLVILAMVAFFLVVQENRRQLLEQEGFRILSGFGSSMNEKEKVISKISRELGPAFDNYRLTRIQKKGIRNITGKTIPGTATAQFIYSDSTKREMDGIRDKQIGNISLSEQINISYGRRTITQDSIDWPSGHDSLFSCAMSINDFIAPLLRKEFFSGFLLMDKGQIVFSSFPGEILVSGVEIQKDPPGFYSLGLQVVNNTIKKDTSGKEEMKIFSGEIREITIAGKSYKMFIRPVPFHGKNNFLLAGFVGKKEFTGWTRNLPPDAFLILTGVLLLLLCSIPGVRIFSHENKVKISGKEIVTIWTATAATVFLLVLASSAFLVRHDTNRSLIHNLRDLNFRIKNSFRDESALILKEMLRYDSIRSEDQDNILYDPKTKANSGGRILCSVLDDTAYSKYNHPDYKFFNTVFWADETGDQRMLCTPYETASLSNISRHEYFLQPDKYFRVSGKDSMWYGMEPGFSGNKGRWEIAFSSFSLTRSPGIKHRSAGIVSLTS